MDCDAAITPSCRKVYETEPVDCPPGSQGFLNGVMEIECDWDPMEILETCQDIEEELGRPKTREKNAPRIIDIDLLYYGELVCDTKRLTLPHPLAHKRWSHWPSCDLI